MSSIRKHLKKKIKKLQKTKSQKNNKKENFNIKKQS